MHQPSIAQHGDVSSRPMKSWSLARLLVPMAALAIACVAPATHAKTHDSSGVLPSSPRDASAHPSVNPTDQQNVQGPQVGAPLGPGGPRSHRRHGGGTVADGNCAASAPSTPTAGVQGGHRHRTAPLPPTTPCPPPDPGSGGLNCDNTSSAISPPIAITPPVVIAPPTSNAGPPSRGHRHRRGPLPPTDPTTTTTPSTTTASTTTPCPSSDPTAGGTGTDGGSGFTDIIATNHPHKHPPRQAPEPGTMGLLALGLGSLWLARRRGKKC